MIRCSACHGIKGKKKRILYIPQSVSAGLESFHISDLSGPNAPGILGVRYSSTRTPYSGAREDTKKPPERITKTSYQKLTTR